MYRNKHLQEDNIILTIGLTRIWAGITNVAKGLDKYKIKYIFYYLEINPAYLQNTKGNYRILKSPNTLPQSCICLLKAIVNNKPKIIEVYHHLPNPTWLILQTLIAYLFKIPIVTIFTGGEILYWKNHNLIKKLSVRIVSKLSKLIIYKELYMPENISKYKISTKKKMIFIHNCIPAHHEQIEYKNSKNILFLNSFKKWRNIDLLIKGVFIALKIHPEIKVNIVGMRNEKEGAYYLKLIHDYKLEDVITLHKFTNETEQFYSKAMLFVLLADVVFLNNALLEAMSRSITPIISNVQGAEFIIDHGINGFIIERDSEILSNIIIELFNDLDRCRQIGLNACKKIETAFSEEIRSELIYKSYSNYLLNN